MDKCNDHIHIKRREICVQETLMSMQILLTLKKKKKLLKKKWNHLLFQVKKSNLNMCLLVKRTDRNCFKIRKQHVNRKMIDLFLGFLLLHSIKCPVLVNYKQIISVNLVNLMLKQFLEQLKPVTDLESHINLLLRKIISLAELHSITTKKSYLINLNLKVMV